MTVANYCIGTTTNGTPAYTCPAGRLAKLTFQTTFNSTNLSVYVKYAGSASGHHSVYGTTSMNATYGIPQSPYWSPMFADNAQGNYCMLPAALILTPGDFMMMPYGNTDGQIMQNHTGNYISFSVTEIDLPT